MLDYLWGGMILLGVIYGICGGAAEEINGAILSSAGEAVSLAVTLFGVVSLWTGIMETAKEAGLLTQMEKLIRPFVRFLFPGLPEDHPAQEHIAMNMISNFLGLGNAALPEGIRAMECLADLERERGNPEYLENSAGRRRASPEMCTFLVINISSLQLIPVNMIAYRSQYGSIRPAAIVGMSIAATTVSTLAAVIFCRIMGKAGKRGKGTQRGDTAGESSSERRPGESSGARQQGKNQRKGVEKSAFLCYNRQYGSRTYADRLMEQEGKRGRGEDNRTETSH